MNPFEAAQKIAEENKARVIKAGLDDKELMAALRAIALEGASWAVSELRQEANDEKR